MNTIKKILLPIIFLCGLFFNSCKEDDTIINLDREKMDLRMVAIKAPIATINFEVARWLDDIIEDGDLKIDPVSDIAYVEFNQTESLNWEDLKTVINIIDEQYTHQIDGTSPESSATEWENTERAEVQLIDRADARYDFITYASGTIEFEVSNIPAGLTGDIAFSIPEIIKNGQPFSETVSLPVINNRISLSLGNGRINFTHGSLNNLITVISKIVVSTPTGGATPYSFSFTIKDLDVESAEGYFGQVTASEGGNSFDFSLFDELKIQNEFAFGNITLEATVNNNIGVPFKVQADNIRMFKDDVHTGNLIINNEGIDESVMKMEITSAQANPVNAGYGNSVTDKNNSNIAEMGSTFPNKILFDINGMSNHEGIVVHNFISKESNLDIDLTLKFPFDFRAKLYERLDTIEFDIKDLLGDNVKTAEDVEYANIIFKCANRLPLDVALEAWVIDDQDQKVDVIFGEKKIIESGVPDANGRITEAKHTQFVVELTGVQVINFINKNVMNIVMKTKANTHDGGSHFVQIFGNSGAEIRVSLDGKTTIPTNF